MPLIKVNCAAIPESLLESELFGHVRGAFTGATGARTGRFEVADGGTIFLDEIGELPLDTQVKLLRVLQEREIEPVGSSTSRKVDVRVIAATNRDLQREVAEGRFRADLYFRLNVFPVVVPPLREREDDVVLLAHFFVDRFAREFRKPIERIAPEALERFLAYPWPGNVRELSNVIERAVVLARGSVLDLAPGLELELASAGRAAPLAAGPAPGMPAAPEARRTPEPGRTLEEMERRHVQETLDATGWVIEGPRGAAASLGLSASTLRSRMKRLGVRRQRGG
jgi:transcriptional regulator with GAF, ATPase, and Fis domain